MCRYLGDPISGATNPTTRVGMLEQANERVSVCTHSTYLQLPNVSHHCRAAPETCARDWRSSDQLAGGFPAPPSFQVVDLCHAFLKSVQDGTRFALMQHRLFRKNLRFNARNFLHRSRPATPSRKSLIKFIPHPTRAACSPFPKPGALLQKRPWFACNLASKASALIGLPKK